MPQKHNPDCMELIRGKTGTILGKVCSLLIKKLQKNILRDVIMSLIILILVCWFHGNAERNSINLQ